ncbi:MAG: AzlD domain-containing protein [Parasporobacterium sp.]|nr:AzlD domain-containing protein [Parasporobacterium sp.]
MSNTEAIIAIAIMSAVTILLRALPFLVFRKKTPEVVVYLGKYLPYAVMGMLVVYCLKDMSFITSPFGAPEVISIVLVVVLYVWRRNTLLSIIAGTASYMLLTQLVFV